MGTRNADQTDYWYGLTLWSVVFVYADTRNNPRLASEVSQHGQDNSDKKDSIYSCYLTFGQV
jgi:hypothetical protein